MGLSFQADFFIFTFLKYFLFRRNTLCYFFLDMLLLILQVPNKFIIFSELHLHEERLLRLPFFLRLTVWEKQYVTDRR
jgi:hypothetical protein